MPNTSMGADAFCPYYISDKPTSIRCQSVCLEGGECVQRFKNEQDKEMWQNDVCCNARRHRMCPIAYILYALHEEE